MATAIARKTEAPAKAATTKATKPAKTTAASVTPVRRGRPSTFGKRCTESIARRISEWEDFIPVSELALIFSVTAQTIRSWATNGYLPVVFDRGTEGDCFSVPEVTKRVKQVLTAPKF